MLCILQQYHLLPPIYSPSTVLSGTAKAPSPTKFFQQKEIQDFTNAENHHVEDNMVPSTGNAEFQFKLMSSDTAKSSGIFHNPSSHAVCCSVPCTTPQHVAATVPLWFPCSSVAFLAHPPLPYPLMLCLSSPNTLLKVAKAGFLWEFEVQYVHTLGKHLFAVPG